MRAGRRAGARGTRAYRGHGARGRCRTARGDPRRVGVGPRRRGAGGGTAGDRRGARGSATRADGDPVRRARAVRPPRARAARRRRHHAQRRGGAHARRQRARTWAARPPCPPRSRLPAPRRHAPARLGTRVPSRSARARDPLGEDQPRRRDRARRRSMAPAARAVRPHPGARAGGGAGGHRARPPPRALRGRARRDTRAAGLRRHPGRRPRGRPRRRVAASSPPGPRGSCATIWRRRPARADWPEVERQAAEKIEAALARLAGLDAVEAAPGVAVFRRTLELELDADLGRVGRLGDGLLLGHVALGLGLDLDRVFVCGLAEGLFPTRVRDDSLLPDADRRATDGALALRSARVDDDHRRLLAALASASQERILLFPRGDLRRTTERVPSRFLVESLAAVSTGASSPTISPSSMPTGTRRCRRSRPGSRASSSPPPSRSTGSARCSTTPGPAAWSPRTSCAASTSRCDAGSTRVVARASGRDFTRFDGNLAGCDAGRVTDGDVVVSPTRLQTYAANPFDYFLDYVLRVDIPELPEERYEVSPLDRGSLVHETLDAFLSEVLARPGGAPAPEEPWTDADRDRLREIAEARCGVYEAQGRTGRRLFWHRDRRRLLAELDRFLSEDTRARAGFGLRTIATELRFGFPDAAPAVDLELSDGRALRFRGAADRVDRTAGGGALGDRLQDRPPERRRPRGPDRGRPDAPAPRVRTRGAGVVRRSRHGRGRGVLVRQHAGPVPLGRARALARGRRPRRRGRCASSPTASTPGCSRAGSTPRRPGPGGSAATPTPTPAAPATGIASGSASGSHRRCAAMSPSPNPRSSPRTTTPKVPAMTVDGDAATPCSQSGTAERSRPSSEAQRRGAAELPRSRRGPRHTRRDRRGARRDAVRRSRRGLGQDQGVGRPRRRAGRPGAACRCARSPPSPSPRRRRPSCATGSGARSRPRPAAARRSPRLGPRSRSRSSTAPRCPPCTRSRSGSWPSTRSKRGSRRASRCSMTSRRSSRSRSAGRASSTSCSTTPRSSARCSSRSTPTPPSTSCARWRWRATRTGTSSPSAWDPSPTRRRSTVPSRRSSSRSPSCTSSPGTAWRPTTSCSDCSGASPRGTRSSSPRPTSTSSCASSPWARRRGASPRAARTTGPERARWSRCATG